MILWDTSSPLKAYVEEAGSRTVRTMLRRRVTEMVLTNHVALEVVAGLGKSFRVGTLTEDMHVVARQRFLRRYHDTLKVFDVTASSVIQAFSMAITYRHVGVGAMDILHLAFAIELRTRHGYRPFVVVSSDHGLLALAKAQGLETFDPETEPLNAFMARYRRMSRNGGGGRGIG